MHFEWLILIVLVCCCSCYVKQAIRDDPTQDIYENLDSERLEEWSHGHDIGLLERIFQLLTPIEEVIQIQIILVGFKEPSITPACIHLKIQKETKLILSV